MQIFLPYKEPINVARCLDKRRLHKQILEADQIIKSIKGESKSWKNHPVVKMFKNHLDFLINYRLSLYYYRFNDINKSSYHSKLAVLSAPDFITEDLCIQHRKRLYTKDNDFYKDFSPLGESYENWYIVDNNILKYKNGKLLQS